MPLTDPAFWSEHLRRTLECYDEPLLRQVAVNLVKPRNQWPAEELIKRSVETVSNAPVIDRRLKDLDPAGRRLLALIGHSRQPRWYVGNLIELLAALGHADGLAPVLALLHMGLLYPELFPSGSSEAVKVRCSSFETWLGQTSSPLLTVFAHPSVSDRALGEDLGLPDVSAQGEGKAELSSLSPQEADGLEWPLRLAVLWQQVAAAPLRRTQQRDFFKRDLDRLRGDPLLSGPPADSLADLPDPALLVVALGVREGLLCEADGELRAGVLPAAWDAGLPAALASLWSALPQLESWNAEQGWNPGIPVGNPYPSAYLLTLLLLGRLPETGWVSPKAVAHWVIAHHPYWRVASEDSGAALERFLLGFAYQLRLLQAARDTTGEWLIRLSVLGRWVLGLGEAPVQPSYAQTLLVQPNLQVLVYRQGLTPSLITRLGRFAAWKGLGAACTLQLQPDTVYAALESGETFETILNTLQRHSMKETPAAVVNSLRTWANKRERISVYASAALFEFASAEDLNDALARGLPAVRLTERLAVVPNEKDIDYRHFRLTATRDYALPPEKCITVEPDGVTLSIDQARADLLLEIEVQRFAEPLERGESGRRQYRLTPASLGSGRAGGLSVQALEQWFLQRSGQPLSAAGRLLLTGAALPPVEFKQFLVLQVASADIADGLAQWPGTRSLIQERLGPTALVVAEEHLAVLHERLHLLGMTALPVDGR